MSTPKFKVGDIVKDRQTDLNGTIYRIDDILNDKYYYTLIRRDGLKEVNSLDIRLFESSHTRLLTKLEHALR